MMILVLPMITLAAAEEPVPDAQESRCAPGAYRLDAGGWLILTPSDGNTLRYRLADGRSGRMYPQSAQTLASGAGWSERTPVVATMRIEHCKAGRFEFRHRDGPASVAHRIALPVRTVSFPSIGNMLYGELHLPLDSQPHALVVLAYGSGTDAATRYNYLQHLLPLHGIAAFVFDKRGTGQSTGTPTADFSALADDTIVALAKARELLPDASIAAGILGESQGGWVAPLAATRASVDFVIAAYGLAIGPLEEDREEVLGELRARGYAEDVLRRAQSLTELTRRVVLSRFTQGLQELERFKAEHRGEQWLEQVEGDFTGPLVRTPPDQLHALVAALGFDIILDYDAAAALRRVEAPMLWVVAGKDTEAPSEPTLAVLRELQARPTQLDIAIFPMADHGMIEAEEPGSARSASHSPGYWDLLAHWIRHRTLQGHFGNAVLEPDGTLSPSSAATAAGAGRRGVVPAR